MKDQDHLQERLDDRLLGRAARLDDPAPPPSADLLRAVEGMRPVRPRRRFEAFVLVGLAGLVWPAVALWVRPMRRDLAALPVGWVVLAAALWGAAFVASLMAALVPRRGDVLPAPARASRVSSIGMAAVLLFAAFASLEVPGLSMEPAERGWSMLEACAHCGLFVLEIAIVFLVAGVLAVRRHLVPIGGRSIGLALGAAGGAMGGLVLHFICPFAATGHVVVGHVGGMLMAAAAGALALRLATRS